MQHHAPAALLLAVLLATCLVWQDVESITITSRGEPPTPASSQNFTLALQLLERMLLSQQRQRRLIPYYSYYVVNDNHNNYNEPRPVPTPFPVQNTALDLLVKSLFSPHTAQRGFTPIRNSQAQLQQQQQRFQQPHNIQQPQQVLQPLQQQHTRLQQQQPTPQQFQHFRPNYAPLPYIKPSYADLLPYLVKSKPIQPSPPPPRPLIQPAQVNPLPGKNYADILRFLAQNSATTTPTPLTTETPEPEAPSFPRLLSPLASVTKFPGPPATKAGKDAPGRPGLDYPTFNKIPPTSFTCASQRYKGFFADPDTHCQVWHYCDLNGGQASFLCPNGTIFSQVLLTCDWWFNVKCTNTLQAYVLNERLYKYIMPKKPSFPEDFTGPQVDDYLTQKQGELREKEQAKFERLKKKYKAFEFEDVDELQALLDKMRNANAADEQANNKRSNEEIEKKTSEEYDIDVK